MLRRVLKLLFFLSILCSTSHAHGRKGRPNQLQNQLKCLGGPWGSCSGGEGPCNRGRNSGCCPPEPIKCCDPSCPKCIGGKAPKPGSGCLSGCPLGGCCPGSCPCDACVCCYTTTTYQTVLTTCYNEEKSVRTRTSTKLKSETIYETETKIVPVTFSVDEIFLFTSTLVLTRFAYRPSFTIETLSTLSVLSQSTIFLSTVSITALSTTRTADSITITTNPVIVTTVFLSFIAFTSTVPTFLPTAYTSVDNTLFTQTIVTNFFNFTYTTEPVFTFPVTSIISLNLTAIAETFTREVVPRTSDGTTLATSTLINISGFITSVYSTGAFTTVPGGWTYYIYGTADADKTLVTSTIGLPVITTRVVESPVSETLTVTQTENLCPTRTVSLDSVVTTVFVLTTATVGTTSVMYGTSTAVYTIPSTIVFANGDFNIPV